MTVNENHSSDKIPELRFTEFESEWVRIKLRDAAGIERGKFTPRPRNNPIYYGGSIPFVQTSDVVNSGGRINTFTQTLNEKGLGVSKLFPVGSILITIAANIGYSGVLEKDMACPDSLIGLKCKDHVYNYFLNYYLYIHQKRMDNLASKAAQKNINIEFLSPYPVTIPTLPEQQKIAAFLSAVDKKIQQLTRKKELLELYKKGVMQKIFSQEIRFKGFDEPWQSTRIENHFSFKNGLNKEKEFFGKGTPIINFRDVYHLTGIRKQDLTGLVELNQDEITRFSAMKGDVFFTRTSETIHDIGMSATLLENITDCVFSGFVLRARPIDDILVDEFKKYCFATNSVRKEIVTRSSFTTRALTSGTLLNGVIFRFPRSKVEQQKIAVLISTLDAKINLVTLEMQCYIQFKKGLLQQMFV